MTERGRWKINCAGLQVFVAELGHVMRAAIEKGSQPSERERIDWLVDKAVEEARGGDIVLVSWTADELRQWCERLKLAIPPKDFPALHDGWTALAALHKLTTHRVLVRNKE